MDSLGSPGSAGFAPDPSPSPKPGSKLDSLPRDELVKYLKKQQAALQQSKSKCQALTQRVEELERANGPPNSEVEDKKLAEKQVEVLHQECDELKTLLEETQIKTNAKINGLHEEIECLTQARDTAVAALKEFQDEGAGASRQLRTKLKELEDERADFVENVAKYKDLADKFKHERDAANKMWNSLDAKCRDLESQVSTIESESSDTEALVSNLRTKLVEAEAEIASLSEDNDQMQRDHQARLKSMKSEMLDKDDEIAGIQQKLNQRTTELAEARSAVQSGVDENEAEWRGHLDEFQRVKLQLSEQERLNDQLNEQIQTKDSEVKSMTERLKIFSDVGKTKLIATEEVVESIVSTVNSEPPQSNNPISSTEMDVIPFDKATSDIVSKLQSEISDLNCENFRLEKENAELVSKLDLSTKLDPSAAASDEQPNDCVDAKIDQNDSGTTESNFDSAFNREHTKLKEILSLKEDEIEELQNECTLKRNEISRLQDEFIQWSKEREKLVEGGKNCADCSLLRSQVHSMTTELGQAETTLASADNRMERVSEMIRGMKEENSGLKEENTGLKEENSGLTDENGGFRAQIDTVRKEVEQFSVVNNELMEENSGLKDEVDSVKKVVEELKETNFGLVDEQTSLKEEMGRMMKHAEDVQEEITGLNEKINVLKEEINSRNKDVEEFKGENDSLKEENNVFTVEINGLKEENVSLKEEIGKLGWGHNEAEDESEESNAELDSLNLENTDLKREIGRIQEECGSVNEDNRDLKQQLMCLETDNDDLKSKLTEARATYAAKVTELGTEVTRLTASCSNGEDTMAELSETVRLMEQKNEELRDQLLTLEAERNVVQNDLNTHTASDNELINETLEEIDDLKTQLADAKSENVAELREKVENLENKNLLLTDDLAESREYALELTTQTKDLSKQLTDVQAALESAVNSEKEIKDELEKVESQLSEVQSEKANFTETLTSCELLLAKEKEKSARLTDQLENISGEMSKLSCDLDTLRVEKTRLEADYLAAKQNLTQTAENHEQHNLLSLEMADYERSVANLQHQLKEKDGEIAGLKKDISSREEARAVTAKDSDSHKAKTQKLEETVTKLKALVVKTRKECAETKEQIAVKQGVINDLEGKVMTTNDDIEKLKLDLAKAVSESRSASERLTESLDSKDSVLHSAESQVITLRSELRSTRQQLSAVQEEYQAYKIKVKNVLKQQKESAQDDSWQIEKDHLTKTVQLVQDKLQETSNLLASLRKQHASLQDDYDQTVQDSREQMQQLDAKEKALRAELDRVISERDHQAADQTNFIKQLTAQNESIRNEFQNRIQNMQSEHNSSMDTMQERLTFAESELSLARRRSAVESAATTPGAEVPIPTSTTPNLTIRIPNSDDPGGVFLPPGIGVVPPLSERIPGVGSESIDTPKAYSPISSPTNYRNVVSLEDLIKGNNHDLVAAEADNLASPVRADAMLAQLDAAAKRIQHLSEVMNESEANNARLTEQVKLLKEEIRRLERNEERKEHVANAEYLKNVIMKFLSLKGGDERTRLLPVLQTMLRPNAEEMRILSLLAKGEDALDSESAGWTGYLHRWTGISS